MAQTRVALYFDVSDSMRSPLGDGTPLMGQFALFGSSLAAVPNKDLVCPVDMLAVGWSDNRKVIVERLVDHVSTLKEVAYAIQTAAGFNNRDTPHASAIASALTYVGLEGKRAIFLTTDEIPRAGVSSELSRAVATGVEVTLIVYRGNRIAESWRDIFIEVGISAANVIDVEDDSSGRLVQTRINNLFLHCAPSA